MQSLNENKVLVASNPLIIEDIVVVGRSEIKGKAPTGEFGVQLPMTKDLFNVTDRLFNKISNLIKYTTEYYQKHNYDAGTNNISIKKLNNITRMITNEFFFYTRHPLKIEEFQDLVTRIITIAKEQSKNLHLVLASFAVITQQNLVMNVVCHIVCGNEPQIQLIVKNNSADIDPAYYMQKNSSSFKIFFKNVNKIRHDISQASIRISNKTYPFSYDNIVVCESAAKTRFYTCIDICLDHRHGVAKMNFEAKLFLLKETSAVYCSHILVSNTITSSEIATIGSKIIQADPCFVPQFTRKKILDSDRSFGTTATLYLQEPSVCATYTSPIPLKYEINNIIIKYAGWSLIHLAVYSGDIDVVNKIINEGAELLKTDETGSLPISIALKNNNVPMFILLFNYMHDHNLLSDTILKKLNDNILYHKNYPLILFLLTKKVYMDRSHLLLMTAAENQLEIVKFIINQKLGYHQDDEFKALLNATEHNHFEIVKELVNGGVDLGKNQHPDMQPLFLAFKNGNSPIFQYLLDKMALDKPQLNKFFLYCIEHLYQKNDVYSRSAMFKLLPFLMDKGLILPTKSNDPYSLLHLLAQADQDVILLKVLLMNPKININLLGSQNNTPLHIAVLNNANKVIPLLLNYGADPNLENSRNETAILWTLRGGNINFFKQLFNKMLEINSEFPSTQQINALFKEALSFHAEDEESLCSYEDIHIILNYKPNLHITSSKGLSLLELALRDNKQELIMDLISQNINEAINNNGTALHLAVIYNHLDLVIILLEKGADLWILNKNNYLPIELAIKNNHLDVFELLYSKMEDIKPSFVNDLFIQTLRFFEIGDLSDEIYYVAKFLIKRKADINSTVNGSNLMHLAVKYGRLDIIEYLIKKTYFMFNTENDSGHTPLYLSLKESNYMAFGRLYNALVERGEFKNKDKVQEIYKMVESFPKLSIKFKEILWQSMPELNLKVINMKPTMPYVLFQSQDTSQQDTNSDESQDENNLTQ